jgi:dipeptidase E
MGHQKENHMNTKITHIFLAGGGGAEDSKLLDEQFVKMLDLTKPLVYIPNAMRSKPYQSCLQWFRSVMAPLGVTVIEMWDDLRPRRPVEKIAGLYIGGGDTVKLLKEIRGAGFDKYLLEVARSSTPLYGGSAGAIILGEDIRTAPEASQLNATEAAGFKLIKNHSIVCHYKVDDREATAKLSKALCQNVIAIPEKTGGYVAERTLINYGMEPIVIIQGDRVDAVHPNSSIRLEERR